MKSLKISAIILLLSFGLNAFSQNENKINITPEEFPEFTKIEANGSYTLILNKGEKQEVWVEADREYKEEIDLEVKKNTLKISSNSIKRTSGYIVYLSYKNLTSIDASGVIEINGKDKIVTDNFIIESSGASSIELILAVKKLSIDISGASELKLSGSADTNYIDISGASDLQAYELKTNYTYVDISGAGCAKVNASEEISGDVSGASDLKYLEEPAKLMIDASGVADISSSDRKIDTTRLKLGGSEIIIIDDEAKKAIAKAKKLKKKKKYNGHWEGIEFGINGYLNSDYNNNLPTAYSFLDLKQENSWSIELNALEQNINLIKNKFGITTGLGFQMNNYKFSNDINLSSDSATIYGYHDTIHNYTKSKLNVNYLTIPLLFEYQTNNKSKLNSFHFAVGGIFGLKVGSHTKMVYTSDDKKEKIKSRDDFHLNPIKYEATVRIGWGKINLFVNYALSTLFEKNEGPEMYPFTAGISLSDI